MTQRAYPTVQSPATPHTFSCDFCARVHPWSRHGGGSRTARYCDACAAFLDLIRRGNKAAALDAIFGDFGL